MLLLFNDCGAIELDIALELYSIERFGHVDLRLQSLVHRSTCPLYLRCVCISCVKFIVLRRDLC